MSNLLVDSFGRIHRSLRISVTDRCNIRCQYCMPDGPIQFLRRSELLTYEEIASLVGIISEVGIQRIRLTGGEPLVRQDLHRLVAMLKGIHNIESVTLTTNGMLLEEQIDGLVRADLDGVNISLDTLSEQTFKKLSRRDGLDRVLAGIDAAIRTGLRPQLNAVLLRDINFDDAIPLVEFALHRGLTIRFIEFMPLDSDRSWSEEKMISGFELRSELSKRFGPLVPQDRFDPSRPAKEYKLKNGDGTIGFIDSVTKPFCGGCDRLRLTAEGKLRNCLFGREEWDIGSLLRVGSRTEAPLGGTHDRDSMRNEVLETVRECLSNKYASHGMSESDFMPPERPMYQIGG